MDSVSRTSYSFPYRETNTQVYITYITDTSKQTPGSATWMRCGELCLTLEGTLWLWARAPLFTPPIDSNQNLNPFIQYVLHFCYFVSLPSIQKVSFHSQMCLKWNLCRESLTNVTKTCNLNRKISHMLIHMEPVCDSEA